MNVLESPLEALALNYLSLGFLTAVNNLWTWVAVLTAAFSFWKIRTSGGVIASAVCLRSGRSKQSHGNDRSPTRPAQAPETSVAKVSSDEPPAPAPATGIPAGEVGLDEVTKGTKFVAVYGEDADQKGNAELAAENDEYYHWEERGGDECHGIGKWWESWERELRTRTGEKGWYRYQDLRVLNGNVVRLWENTTSCTRDLRYYSSSCIAW
ncbi:uncharacterized protein LOC121253618 [Juglans microcarpa x Juglans regia]|uniref:uncharacterized protein LOC121253618 n=1 Tax=Juglans microcarpa x Juglans regia TaxID=2249226 RepID=UPI001B7E4311|nr:uncharacterized protein LOC121253618 [Juglans microcarpa x Juglans regia]